MLKKITATSVIIAVISIIFIANSSYNFSYEILTFIHGIPLGDKVLHFLLVGSMTIAVNYFWKHRTTQIFSTRILLGSALVLVFMTFEEFGQAFVPHRHFEIADLLCNYAGIFVASKISRF